jgi:signal transduction histidine kinase
MMEKIHPRLKQFEAWATGLRERYNSDLSFNTAVHISALQAGLVACCLIIFFLAIHIFHGENELAMMALVALGVLVVSGLFITFLGRYALRPARDTLHYQKLFVSNVAHELRTPLSTIKTSTEVALLDRTVPANVRKIFNEILAELERVSTIINNLLSLNTLTRPERMQFENVDLGITVGEVIKRHTLFANERDIKIMVKKDAHRVVWGSRIALEQVASNLLKNAISYTPQGGSVVISIHPDYRGMIVLSFADTGIGISQQDLFHIFEPFYRADASRVRQTKHSGSGLGLTIVNEIVRAHHGKIQIQSAVRKGTTVSVFLPSGMPLGASAGAAPARQNEVSIDFSKGTLEPRQKMLPQ